MIIEIPSYPLIRHLLFPNISASKIYYCGKILGKTYFTDFIELVSCTD